MAEVSSYDKLIMLLYNDKNELQSEGKFLYLQTSFHESLNLKAWFSIKYVYHLNTQLILIHFYLGQEWFTLRKPFVGSVALQITRRTLNS